MFLTAHLFRIIYMLLVEKEMATHSSIPAWIIPWTEEPGRLQSVGSQRVRHDLVTEQQCAHRGFPGGAIGRKCCVESVSHSFVSDISHIVYICV